MSLFMTVFKCICMHEFMYVCKHICIVCLYTCVHVSMCICIYVYIMYACVHTCIYVIFKLGFERYRGGIVLVGRGIVRGGYCPGEVSGGELSRGKCPGPGCNTGEFARVRCPMVCLLPLPPLNVHINVYNH